ncbi:MULTISPECIES: hypothetical protein [unclassified Sphingomonas]|uniref:hypothetical protein n=1 Tax=unclassified Sphingomonas TaxID=196159 RepID=UPI00083515D2|nr:MULTISPECIES: hypothetical protein [unclassified Sphingomonas]
MDYPPNAKRGGGKMQVRTFIDRPLYLNTLGVNATTMLSNFVRPQMLGDETVDGTRSVYLFGGRSSIRRYCDAVRFTVSARGALYMQVARGSYGLFKPRADYKDKNLEMQFANEIGAYKLKTVTLVAICATAPDVDTTYMFDESGVMHTKVSSTRIGMALAEWDEMDLRMRKSTAGPSMTKTDYNHAKSYLAGQKDALSNYGDTMDALFPGRVKNTGRWLKGTPPLNE